MYTGPEDSLESEVQENTEGDVDPLETESEPPRRSEDLDGDVEGIKNDSMRLLQELEEENDRLSRRNMELQAQMVFHLRGTTPHEQDPEPDTKEYQECLEHLVELRRQRASQMEKARRQEEELRLNNQEKLNRVARLWLAREFHVFKVFSNELITGDSTTTPISNFCGGYKRL